MAKIFVDYFFIRQRQLKFSVFNHEVIMITWEHTSLTKDVSKVKLFAKIRKDAEAWVPGRVQGQGSGKVQKAKATGVFGVSTKLWTLSTNTIEYASINRSLKLQFA